MESKQMRISIRRRLDAIEAKMAGAKARTSGQTMELLDTVIANGELENAIRYLKAGRRFAGYRDDKLKSVWTKVWRAYYDHDRTELWPYCIDADAELMLRRLPRPSTGASALGRLASRKSFSAQSSARNTG
jgi:hypothetical protein